MMQAQPSAAGAADRPGDRPHAPAGAIRAAASA